MSKWPMSSTCRSGEWGSRRSTRPALPTRSFRRQTHKATQCHHPGRIRKVVWAARMNLSEVDLIFTREWQGNVCRRVKRPWRFQALRTLRAYLNALISNQLQVNDWFCRVYSIGSDRPFKDPFSWRTPPEYLSRKSPFLFRTSNML
jgi:hypothetical protein